MRGKWSCRERGRREDLGTGYLGILFPTGLGAKPSVSPSEGSTDSGPKDWVPWENTWRPLCLHALHPGSSWAGGTHLAHHVGGGLPAPGANVLVEGDVEVGGRLVVLDHVEEGGGTLGAETGTWLQREVALGEASRP